MSYRKRTRDQHFFDEGPKRILCLDGGGLRGSHTLGVLKVMEELLGRRYGNEEDFRLADYFDLIAGTSTGAIIAAMLALGKSVEEIYPHYEKMGSKVFRKTFVGGLSFGLVRSRYDKDVLKSHLQSAVDADTVLGDESLQTGLLILAKRIDTHSVWPVGNNPEASYFNAPVSESGKRAWVPNREYPLLKLLRASAAAPTYFDPVEVEITKDEDPGHFIDGGMTPYNDPSLQALMYATLSGYRVGWPTGADKLLLVSVGTGSFKPPSGATKTGVMEGVPAVTNAFLSVLYDNQRLTRTLMQWASDSPTSERINSEIGDLSPDLIGGQALLTYVRFDTKLEEGGLAPLIPHLAPTLRGRNIDLKSLRKMDEPANVKLLWEIGKATGTRSLREDHFPSRFDLDAPGPRSLRVGVIGHRDNVLHAEDKPALSARVEETLARIARMCRRLTVISALAEGADRIGARIARDAGYGLICPLPFAREEYENDFASEESRQEFAELLDAAAEVRELNGDRKDSTSAYQAVGDAVLRRCDLLVAVWDGETARGRGGTAEVVEAAAGRMPVVWIHSDPTVRSRLVRLGPAGSMTTAPDSELEAAIAEIMRH